MWPPRQEEPIPFPSREQWEFLARLSDTWAWQETNYIIIQMCEYSRAGWNKQRFIKCVWYSSDLARLCTQ